MSEIRAIVTANIKMKPVGRKSHRTVTKGRATWNYDPSKEKKHIIYINTINQIIPQLEDKDIKLPYEGPIHIFVLSYILRPKNHFVNNDRKRGKLKKSAPANYNCTKKPDCSNVLKLVEDAYNKVIFKDDSQVVSATTTKQWVEHEDLESIEVVISFLGDRNVEWMG